MHPRAGRARRGADTTGSGCACAAGSSRHPLCAHCLKRGFTTPATEVDHIKPLREGGARLPKPKNIERDALAERIGQRLNALITITTGKGRRPKWKPMIDDRPGGGRFVGG